MNVQVKPSSPGRGNGRITREGDGVTREGDWVAQEEDGVTREGDRVIGGAGKIAREWEREPDQGSTPPRPYTPGQTTPFS
jgi:hypothetical protein